MKYLIEVVTIILVGYVLEQARESFNCINVLLSYVANEEPARSEKT